MSSVDPVWLAIKLARGVKHLESINDEVKRVVDSDDCGIVSDFQSEPGYLVVKAYMGSAPSPLCSVYIGEALYQLRSALDHLVCYLTESNGQVVENKTEFPIFLAREKFRDDSGALTPAIRQRIGGILPAHRALIEGEQPFQGKYGVAENDPLWWLYRLSNYDRHHYMHLVGNATLDAHDEFTPQWFADRYFTRISANFGTFEGETEVARYRIDPAVHDLGPPPVAVQVNSNVSFGIAFDKEGPGVGMPVVRTLKAIGDRVSRLFVEFFPKAP